MKATDEPIVVEQTFRAPIAELWGSITDVNRMRLWFFDNIPEFRAEVGFTTRFTVESGGRRFVHLWEVVEVVPPRRISYRWRYDGTPGDSVVEFALSDLDGSSKLRVTCHVKEDFPEEIPEFRRESCVAGWEFFVVQRLKDYLEGTE